MNNTTAITLAPNGSPLDRGACDAYYSKRASPHWWPSGTLKGQRIGPDGMSDEQVAAYYFGYLHEDDRKEW